MAHASPEAALRYQHASPERHAEIARLLHEHATTTRAKRARDSIGRGLNTREPLPCEGPRV
jgi:hypothetical protein